MNDDTDVPPRSSRQNPAYRPTSDTPAPHRQRIQSDARQIHTRSVAPYCYAIRDAGSGYVLTTLRAYAYAIALSRALRSIRALCHPGVALRLPRAVFWRPFRALYSPSPFMDVPTSPNIQLNKIAYNEPIVTQPFAILHM